MCGFDRERRQTDRMREKEREDGQTHREIERKIYIYREREREEREREREVRRQVTQAALEKAAKELALSGRLAASYAAAARCRTAGDGPNDGSHNAAGGGGGGGFQWRT